jgi:hypothetical protein
MNERADSFIQYRAPLSTAWAQRSNRRQHCAMPLDRTDLELGIAARACRALAYQEEPAAIGWRIPACAARSRILRSVPQYWPRSSRK